MINDHVGRCEEIHTQSRIGGSPIVFGFLAHLGEHLPCTQGAVGSSPTESTVNNSNGMLGRAV
jgi:hypothetical protein